MCPSSNVASSSQVLSPFPNSFSDFESLTDCCMHAAIVWKKTAYCPNFDCGEKIMSSLPSSPLECCMPFTQPLAIALQEGIMNWLEEVKEGRAQHGFEKYWTGPSGNYTNAPACHCGTYSAQGTGIESRSFYLKRDTCGGSSGTVSLPWH